MTSCMSFTAEPFFLPTEAEVQRPIRAAGFTEAAYAECLQHALDDYVAWKATRLVLSVNPLRSKTRSSSAGPRSWRPTRRADRAWPR